MTVDNRTDEELIQELRREHPEIMDVLMERYKPLVRSRANTLHLIGGEPEDLIQEGMIGLFKAVRDYDPGKNSSFAAFARLCVNRQLYTVLEASGRLKNQPLNTAISFSTEVNPEGELLEETLSRDWDNPEQQILEQEKIREFFEQLVVILSRMEKQVLTLYLQGNNYLQIAEIMNKSPKSIDNTLQRIRTKIRKMQKQL